MDKKPPSDEMLSAWLDGELDGASRAAVTAWLSEHAEDAARVRLWSADREALRARFDPVCEEPIPEALLHTVRSAGRSPKGFGLRRTGAWPAWGQAAAVAGLLLLGGAVGGALVWWQPPARDLLSARLSAQGGWAHRAAVAHVVYAPEVRHPVEVNVAQGSAAEQRAQEEHLSRWLGKRLDMPVRLFDLRPQGFELVGGRLLPDAAGPSAQLMYQNGGGARVTVYLRRPEPGADTAFSFRRDGELGMFYWVEDGFGCALVGKLPREQLLALADAVYHQSEAAAAAAGAALPAAEPASQRPARPPS